MFTEVAVRPGTPVRSTAGLLRDGGWPRDNLDGWRCGGKSVVRFGDSVQYLNFSTARVVGERSHVSYSDPDGSVRTVGAGRRG
ncbi:MAG: hypothetical protein ACQET5_00165 [Halobacteriota archaeon]|uniref:hypothetical protein n=1 Tax=Natronomonas sp. TaxID=2184060 RepID=UPI003974EE06